MNQTLIDQKFESYLRSRSLKLTPQRWRIFERAFATHKHFSAEQLYAWMAEEEGPKVSRATVYRTLSLLEEGGFIESLDTGGGEIVYEHVLGHGHHDHLICTDCGRICEFREPRIEKLQREVARSQGFTLESHSLRLMGRCASCAESLGDLG
ncbi:MAG: Fur family transcriptional regulator [Planctomycetota bacterium]|nr:Fur family transcriptional regulator [Planctomycetota bacterium]